MKQPYNYREAVTEDVKRYLLDNHTTEELSEKLADDDSRDDFAEDLRDTLWTEDSITGNASGSYTFNRWEAEEMLCHNMELLAEAFSAFGSSLSDIERGAEFCDVTIRCYLLSECIETALDELASELCD